MEQSAPIANDSARLVDYRVADNVAWISLNRPKYHNAQNFALLSDLDDAFRDAVDDNDVRVIVLRGEGKNFSAGHDIGTPDMDFDKPRKRVGLWFDHTSKPGAEGFYALEQDAYLGMCRRWQAIPKPTIAMVQGACIAGGLMLAWVCDLIIASEDAYFQDPVVLMGVPGVEYFAHAFELPPRVAREFLMLGRRMSAARAYNFGMVNEVVPRQELESTVHEIALELTRKPSFGLTLTKQAFQLVDDLRGKRTGMEAVLGLHHLAHAHNREIDGSDRGRMDIKSMRASNAEGGNSKVEAPE